MTVPHSLGQLTGEQALLLAFELDLQFLQLGLGVQAAQHREAVLGEERVQLVEARERGTRPRHGRANCGSVLVTSDASRYGDVVGVVQLERAAAQHLRRNHSPA